MAEKAFRLCFKKEHYFSCIGFDEIMIDELDKTGIAAHKIASPELNHLPLIRYAAEKGRPLLLSTGMASLGDVEEAVEEAKKTGNNEIGLFHCVTSYPAFPEDCNLRIIPMLKQAFQLPVGLSDHTTDPFLVPTLSVASGANLIEKHFTISRQLPGVDHKFALEPTELGEMVESIRKTENLSKNERKSLIKGKDAEICLGSSTKRVTSSEKELAACDRRSIMVIKQIWKGERVTLENVRILRAERNLLPGLAPKFLDIIVGRKVIHDVPSGRGILWGDLLS